MVTAIYSLSQVHGAELWLLFWLVCLVAYLILCFAIKSNRTKQGRKNVFIGLLIAEVVVDFIWAIIYYRNGVYINYGIGAVYGMFIWIPALIIAAIIVFFILPKSFVKFILRTDHDDRSDLPIHFILFLFDTIIAAIIRAGIHMNIPYTAPIP